MIKDVTVSRVLERAAELWPDSTALTYERERWNFAEVAELSAVAAAKMARLGVSRGDHVALWSANVPEWVFLQFGLARLGAVLVTANTALGIEDATYLLKNSDAVALVVGGEVKGNDLPATARALDRSRVPKLRSIVTLEAAEVPGARAYEDLSLLPVVDAAMGVNDLINMQYTSGTTGFPKGVMLSSRNIVNNGWRTGVLIGMSPEDRVLCQVPLFHCFGCVITMLASYTHGASVHLIRTFDPLEALKAIRRHDITVIHGVPTMFQACLDHPEAEEHPVETVRTGVMAGAVCPPSLMRRLIEDWGVREMTIGYGLTETSPAVTFTPRSDPPEARCSTIGVPLEGTEIRLVDPDSGADADRGELWVRGEQVMLGYYRNEEETSETVTEDGWLRTGDLGERDETGRYRIVGRIKEMILRGGENVYPAEVEEAIRGFPGVGQVAVFGIRDQRLGEQVACAIVPAAGETFDADALHEFLAGRIALTKVPAIIETVEALPLTASGKVQRFALSELFVEQGHAS